MNLINFLYPLFLTLLIETPIYFEFGNKRSVKALLCLTLLNIVSNLLFNLIYIALDYSHVFLIMGEIIVTFIEGAFLYLIFNSIKKSFLTIPANFLSYIIGALLNNYLVITESDILISSLVFEVLFLLYFFIEFFINVRKLLNSR